MIRSIRGAMDSAREGNGEANDRSDYHRLQWQSRTAGRRHKPCAAWRKPHGLLVYVERPRRQAIGAALRDVLKMHSSRRTLQPTRTCDGGGAYRDRGRRTQPWLTLEAIAVRSLTDLDQAFATAVRGGVQGMLVFTHGFAVLNRGRIMELAAQQRVPILYGWRDFVDEGGLMSYGPDIATLVRGAAHYVDRVLRGEKAADLPVQEPTRLQLAAMGITRVGITITRAA